jgi:hypothetical protein
MQAYNNAPINTPISIPNNGNVPAKFSVNERFQYPLVNRADDYVMAVTRIKVPSQLVETFVVEDEYLEDYSVSIGLYGSPYVKIYWPDSAGYIVRGTTTEFVGVQRHYSHADVLNTLNSMYFNAFHQNLTDQLLTHESAEITTTFDGSGSSFTSSNFALSISPRRLTHIELQIESVDISKFGGGAFNDYVTVTLNAPSSQGSINMLNIRDPDIFGFINTDTDTHLVISDRGFRQCPATVDAPSGFSGNIVYQPKETSLPYVDTITTPSGNWNLTVTSGNATNILGSIKFRVRFYYNNITKPTDPIVLNELDNMVQLVYQQAYRSSRWVIAMSPKINTMINFSPNTVLVGNMYEFDYPFYPASSSIHTHTQSRSSIAQMYNLDRIGVYSFSLPVAESELINNHVASPIITDFIILDQADGTGGNYIYTQDSIPWRYYEFRNSDPIYELVLEVRAIYNDQSERDIYINPGDCASMRVSFFPRG